MEKQIEKNYIKIIYTSLAVSLLFNAMQAGSRLWLLLLLSGLLTLSVTIRHMLLFNRMNRGLNLALAYLPDAALAFLIGLLVSGDGAAAFLLIVASDACLFCPKPVGYGIAGVCFALYAISKYLELGFQSITELMAGISLAGGALLAAISLITITRHELEVRQEHDKILYDLKTKSKQLEDAYNLLREASMAQEEVAVLRERSRIAREMHDGVGHALTCGLISLEAGERLMAIDKEQAVEKNSMAKEQLRKGLAELRRAVRVLGSGTEEADFFESLRALLNEQRRQGISIRDEIAELPKLSAKKQAALHRALQEGLTNGLKHGGGTAFVFQMKQEENCVSFLLEDNGKGCGKIAPGFGLKAMEQRVAAAGGSLRLQSEAGEGFRIEITMPVGE